MKSICEISKLEMLKMGWSGLSSAANVAGGIAMPAMMVKSYLSDDPPPQAPPQAQTINVNHINPDKPDPGTWGNIKNAAGSVADQAVAHPVMALGGAAAAGLGYLALKKMRDKQAKNVL